MSIKAQLKRFSRLFRSRSRILLHRNLQILGQIKELEFIDQLDSLLRASIPENPLLRFGQKVFSQNDEDGIIEAIWQRIAPRQVGSFVEFGVGDGTENNSLNLLAKGWRGAWFGGEEIRFKATGDRLRFQKCWIDRENIASLLRGALEAMDVSQPDLLSLDLDGNDWHLLAALLESGVAPQVIVVEYNATFTPSTHWVMPYNADHQWDGSAYFGASLRAFCSLLDTHGYRLVCCNLTGVNAFFVKKALAIHFQEVPSDPERLYMAPRFSHVFPFSGHPVSVKLLETVLS